MKDIIRRIERLEAVAAVAAAHCPVCHGAGEPVRVVWEYPGQPAEDAPPCPSCGKYRAGIRQIVFAAPGPDQVQ